MQVSESDGNERTDNEERRRECQRERCAEIGTIRTLVTPAHLADVQHVERRSVKHLHFEMFWNNKRNIYLVNYMYELP